MNRNLIPNPDETIVNEIKKIEPHDNFPISYREYIKYIPFNLNEEIEEDNLGIVSYYHSLPAYKSSVIIDEIIRNQKSKNKITRYESVFTSNIESNLSTAQFIYYGKIYFNEKKVHLVILQHELNLGMIILISANSYYTAQMINFIQIAKREIIQNLSSK